MITVQQIAATNIAEIYVKGPLNTEDYEVVTPTVERLLKRYARVNLLVVIDGINGLTPAALWEDFKLSAELLDNLEHVAVVSDKVWLEGLMNAADPALTGRWHHFEPGQRETALAWLEALVPAQT